MVQIQDTFRYFTKVFVDTSHPSTKSDTLGLVTTIVASLYMQRKIVPKIKSCFQQGRCLELGKGEQRIPYGDLQCGVQIGESIVYFPKANLQQQKLSKY